MIDRAVLGWRPYALLVVLCLGLYLPGLVKLPVMDRDEARFAQASRQMVATGDLLHISFQDEPRNKKPAGIYWLQAGAVALVSNAASTAIWPYRLPSLLGAGTAVLLTFALGARLVGRKAAFIGAALLAASLALVAEAHLAKTDAVLLACVTATQGALGIIYIEARRGVALPWRWALLFWAALGIGILIKGPIAPVLALLTAVALAIADREASWLMQLRPFWGVPLLLLIILPWLVAITAATDGAFLGEAVGHDFLGKLIGAQEAHGAPPLYYLLLLAVTFWPGSLFLGPAIAWAWRQRGTSAARFLIAWAVPFWLVLELVPTKLPHYLLPVYPALALAAGAALVAASEGDLVTWRWLDRGVALLWTVAALLLAGVLMLAPLALHQGPLTPGIVAGALVLFFVVRTLRQSRVPGLAVRAVILALLVFGLALEFEAPSLNPLWLSREAAALVASDKPPPGLPVAAVGFNEPSLVFMLGTNTRLTSAAAAAAQITASPGAVALVDGRYDQEFRQALAARGWAPRQVGRISGFDYSSGRDTMLTLYTGTPE